MEAEHGSDQVLEVLSEEAIRFAVLMGSPKLLASVCCNELVVWIIKSGAFERRVSSVKDEQNDSKSEKINDLALIGLLSMDFGSHEAKRSDVRAVHSIAITAFYWASKAEIDDLDIVELVQQDILALEITMSKAFGVDVVDRLNQLFSVVTDNSLAEGARVSNIVEQLATWNKFLSEISYRNLFTILFGHYSAFVELEVFDNVLVVHIRDRLNLVTEELEGTLRKVWVV